MKYQDLLDELEKLKLPKGEYAITGSGPLGVRNIRESKDFDIAVSDTLWKKLSAENEVTSKMTIEIGNIEIFCQKTFGDSSIGPSIKEQISNSEKIGGYPFVNLETIKFYKKLGKRDKDKRDLLLIDGYEKEIKH